MPSDTIGHSNVTGETKQKLYEYVVIDGTGGYGGGEVSTDTRKRKSDRVKDTEETGKRKDRPKDQQTTRQTRG